MSDPSKRIVVGITGASGVIYGIELLRALKDMGYETHLILSAAGRTNILLETGTAPEDVEGAASHVHDIDDLAASVSSGSFIVRGMVVIPCTIKTLSGITHSYNENLMTRAADVCLKEGRRLVLVVRETPLHRGHLELMARAASLGAVILPPMPAFYHKPETIQDLVLHTVGKVLDSLGIPHELFQRWR